MTFVLLLFVAAVFFGIWAWMTVQLRLCAVAERRLELEFKQLEFAQGQHESLMRVHAEQRRTHGGVAALGPRGAGSLS